MKELVPVLQCKTIILHRLSHMKQRVEESIRSELGQEGPRILPLCHMDTAKQGEKVVIVGTLFKNQALKPNILKVSPCFRSSMPENRSTF